MVKFFKNLGLVDVYGTEATQRTTPRLRSLQHHTPPGHDTGAPGAA